MCLKEDALIYLESSEAKQSRLAERFLFRWFGYLFRKQPSIGVLMKMFSENMQQFYRRTPMSKLLSSFIETTLRHGYSLVKLLHIFRTHLPKNTSRQLLLLFRMKSECEQQRQKIEQKNKGEEQNKNLETVLQ